MLEFKLVNGHCLVLPSKTNFALKFFPYVIFFLYLTNGIFFFELIGIIKTTALIKKKLVFIHHAVSHILSASFGTLGKLGTC